jgi:flagellum-specific peptidoglycan hydrolase FlgJ
MRAAAGDHATAAQVEELSKQALDYLHLIAQPALDNQRVFGIPAAITAAQAILEGSTSRGWGTSILVVKANNPFGIKYSHRQGVEDYGEFDAETWEIENGKRVEELGHFQKFPSILEAFTGHALLLMRPRYKPAYQARNNWQLFAERLNPKTSSLDQEHCGYSTNGNYSATLSTLVHEFRLDDAAALAAYAAGHEPVARVSAPA